jgi:hypothetical protein
MSVLNVRVQADRATILVDTMGFRAEDPTAEGFMASKLLPMVHCETVFAARGQVNLLWGAWSAFFLQRDVHFDMIVGKMTETLQGMLLEARSNGVQLIHGDARFGTPLELFVIGRSRETGGLRAMYWAIDTKGEVQGPVEAGGYLSPLRDAAAKPAVLPDGEAEWMTLVREQVADWRRLLPGVPIGGDILLAELSDQGLQVRNVGRID